MAEPIAFEEIARLPLPGTALPTAFAFSPAGDLLTFLDSAEGGLERDLFGLDPASGQRRLLLRPEGGGVGAGGLSLEEQLGRERRRDVGLGVTRYAWARDAPVIVVPLPAGAFVGRPDGNLRLLVPASDGEALDPHLSPDGTMLAFVRAGEVHVAATTGAGAGAPRPLTSGADPAEGRTHGLAEFIAEEEMGRRGGMWWSPGSRWLAVTEVDESEVALWRLGAGGEEAHRYPFAGQANARVRLGVVAAAGAPPRWFALDAEYLARVAWTPGGALVAQLQDRSQRRLDLVRIDPTTGATALLWAEEGEPWVNLHDLYWPLECAGGAFLWGSEASGFRHLSLHGPDGSLTRVLTAGDWVVDQVEGVDEERGLAYVTASRDGPTERHLYAVPLAGGEPQRVTAEPGVHTVRLDRRTTRFVDVHSALDHPPTVALRCLPGGERLHVLHDRADPRAAALGLEPPLLATFASRDGATLHALVYRPPPSAGPPPWPLVVCAYGGPGVQMVTNAWDATVRLRAQHLRQQGLLVASVDNRGSARRGRAFEAAVAGNLGDLEVRDQVDGVRWLAAEGLADPTRAAIYGWSYGGYLSAMALGRAPETFRAAVAGAPVTHWEGYDTHYTERYMGLPAENPDGYQLSSVMHHAGAIRGRLLIVHGLMDENVHFRHTARLIEALTAAGVDYELVLLPGERHLPRDHAARTFVERRVSAFLAEALR